METGVYPSGLVFLWSYRIKEKDIRKSPCLTIKHQIRLGLFTVSFSLYLGAIMKTHRGREQYIMSVSQPSTGELQDFMRAGMFLSETKEKSEWITYPGTHSSPKPDFLGVLGRSGTMACIQRYRAAARSPYIIWALYPDSYGRSRIVCHRNL